MTSEPPHPNLTITCLWALGGRRRGTLVQATDGNLYGTASGGGTSGSCGSYGCGTVFKITPNGMLTTLYNFCSQSGCTDGAYPNELIQAADGDFYGTAFGGGASPACGSLGCGTVFKITPSGTLTTLYNFCAQSGCPDGENPMVGLVQATDGNFYGTMTYGGNGTCTSSFLGPTCGTVFKITPDGTLTTLYSFCSQSGCTDGENPSAPLIQATDGNLYGTVTYGGANGVGTVFKITPSGTFTTIYNFCSQSDCADGNVPYGALVQATDGNLYGTTGAGGANVLYGTAFKITPSGTLTTIYNFCSQSGCADGAYPGSALVQDTNGSFYGTTAHGGASGVGVVFSLSVGLGPFVETQPTSGKLLERVEILGTDLTGATRVTFNHVPAFFWVVSSSQITTWVPPGAHTGYVEVTTPNGRLSSNVPFQVRRRGDGHEPEQ
jgi:uncharacterized repeat protein (TIGR03803 family)